jgi:hypothetical protein
MSPDATRAELRAALLRDVTRCGFVPSPVRQAAWQALCGVRSAFPPDVLLAEEAALRDEVDDFATSFFATPVDLRCQRWRALSARCAWSPPLVARLAALEPGLRLDIRPGDIRSPLTAQLASHVAGLFVLGPSARAAQRQAVLRAMRPDIAGWEEAGKQLRAMAPALVALEPTLLASLLAWRGQQQRLAQVRQARPPVTPRPERRPAPRPAAPAASGSGGVRAIGGVAAVVTFFIIRACTSFGSISAPRPDPPPPPQFEIQRRDPDEFDRRIRKAWQEAEQQRRQQDAIDQLPRDGNETRKRPGDLWPGRDPQGGGPRTPVDTRPIFPRKP